MDRPQLQLAEADPDDLGCSSARQSPASKAWLAQGVPQLGSSELWVDGTQAYNADRRIFSPLGRCELEQALRALRDSIFHR
jgi:hypothetical protein